MENDLTHLWKTIPFSILKASFWSLIWGRTLYKWEKWRMAVFRIFQLIRLGRPIISIRQARWHNQRLYPGRIHRLGQRFTFIFVYQLVGDLRIYIIFLQLLTSREVDAQAWNVQWAADNRQDLSYWQYLFKIHRKIIKPVILTIFLQINYLDALTSIACCEILNYSIYN